MNSTASKADPVKPVVQQDDLSDRVGLWYENNTKLLNFLITVVLLGVIGYSAYNWFVRGRTEKANLEYAQAIDGMNTALNETDDTKRRDGLNGAITAAETVVRDYPKMYVARQAQLLIGNAHYHSATIQGGQGNAALQSAREAYQKYEKMAELPVEKAAAWLAIGHVTQDLLFVTKDTKLSAEVEDAYKQAIRLGEGTYLEAEGKLSLARVYQALEGKQADAEKLYSEVADARKVTPKAEKDGEKVKPIEVEGGGVVSPEQIADMKSFTKLSYAEDARIALERLRALPATK